MATIYDWNKYLNVLHELALVEDEVRDFADAGSTWARRILWERFDVQ